MLALLGCIVYPFHAGGRIYDALGALVIIVTGVVILMNHKTGPSISLICVILLTVDQVRQVFLVHGFELSLETILQYGRPLFNIALYWVTYIWYFHWRIEVS